MVGNIHENKPVVKKFCLSRQKCLNAEDFYAVVFDYSQAFNNYMFIKS